NPADRGPTVWFWGRMTDWAPPIKNGRRMAWRLCRPPYDSHAQQHSIRPQGSPKASAEKSRSARPTTAGRREAGPESLRTHNLTHLSGVPRRTETAGHT